MSATDFEQQLRTLARRRPFFPFVLLMENGERIIVDDPQALAFDGPAEAFIHPSGEVAFSAVET